MAKRAVGDELLSPLFSNPKEPDTVDKAVIIELMLSAKRDVSAARRFLKEMMRARHRRLPSSIPVDKNAAYPEAFSTSQTELIMRLCCKK